MDENRLETGGAVIGKEAVKKFTAILRQYNTGLQPTRNRIISSENWWKLRNTIEELDADGSFRSRSGWLHNVIVSKHADAMAAYPQPVILPREASDKAEAKRLSSIIPCILEQNGFERTYSDVMWQKCKSGTGAYKIIWDSGKLGGLGDITIEKVNLLNLYWEPGVEDIQKSRYFFHTELVDRELLQQQYPQYADEFRSAGFVSGKFLYDDTVDTQNKLTVIDVYYHTIVSGRKVLQYCRYVNEVVLYATENIPEMAERGLYDHGLYPFEFDALFPIEGSPCGYGYVDICRNPQTEIDLLKTSFLKNGQVGSLPRFFVRQDGAINEEEFLDLGKPIVHVAGNLGEDSVRQIPFNPLNDVYVGILDRTIQELRQTSGNTETSTGNVSSGVTAASAIAALQEASGKGSRDATKASYRSFERIMKLCIELIRQFYDMPRQFRILGQYGAEEYISYTNQGLQPLGQGLDFGEDMGYRLPVFDIKISAQKKSDYTIISQNELAVQLFKLGFFNPALSQQALMCLELMEFEGKDTVMQQLSRNRAFQESLAQMQNKTEVSLQKNEPSHIIAARRQAAEASQ